LYFHANKELKVKFKLSYHTKYIFIKLVLYFSPPPGAEAAMAQSVMEFFPHLAIPGKSTGWVSRRGYLSM